MEYSPLSLLTVSLSERSVGGRYDVHRFVVLRTSYHPPCSNLLIVVASKMNYSSLLVSLIILWRIDTGAYIIRIFSI